MRQAYLKVRLLEKEQRVHYGLFAIIVHKGVALGTVRKVAKMANSVFEKVQK